MTDTAGNTLAYTYGTDGLRTEKTYTPVNGTEYYERYYYSESALCYIVYTGGVMSFLYDATGGLLSTNVNGTNYIYLKNAQGDIIGLADRYGNVVVQYTYDAWGNILSITGSLAGTLGQDNPFRYRSYCYDDETGLYYLGSRYYDPEVGRFINADGYVSTGTGLSGYNMFTYCLNNPINMTDDSGYYPCQIGVIYAYADTGGYGNSNVSVIDAKPLVTIDTKSPPPPETGYKTPKNPDKGKNKVPAPGAKGEYGWLDNSGNVWVPDVDMHGEKDGVIGGWRRHYPDGSHDHVYPDGNVRVHAIIWDYPANNSSFSNQISEITGLTGTALIIYIIISEGSRLIPPRNLIPIP